MPDETKSQGMSRKRTWLAPMSPALLAATGALVASLVPASLSAKPSPSDTSMLERRIEAVRDAAEAAASKPDGQNTLQTAQWYNWPNWPNWGNYWPNWGNW